MNGSFKSNLKPFFSKGLNEIVITKPANLERLKLISDEMNLPYDPEMVRVLLSATNYSPPEIIGEIESPESLKHPEKTYLAYGSSITSGGSANLQEFNYPALLARKLGAERLSFGFSGSAKLEKEMADYIASLKGIDYITMELGVNLSWDVANNCWGDPVKFRELVEYFVPTIAEAHKDIPIICTDLFLNANDFFRDQTIFAFRDVVREVALRMERKYRKFKYVQGNDLLTIYDGLNYDVLHPNAIGMVDISDNLYREFIKLKS